jgi:hypothetical protein
MKDFEYITANIMSIIYCYYLGFMNIVYGDITIVQLFEIGMAVLVGLSVVFWNIARGIEVLKKKDK